MVRYVLPVARSFNRWLREPLSKTNIIGLSTSSGAIESELWSLVNYYSEVKEVGIAFVKNKGIKGYPLYNTVFSLFQSYIRQAKSYYSAAKSLEYRSSSLLYYYSFLNLAKAYLVLEDPAKIVNKKIKHGLFYKISGKKDFTKETIVTSNIDELFPAFYKLATGVNISTNTSLNVVKLLAYCSDIGYQYESAKFGNSKYLMGLACYLIDSASKEAWSLLCIPKFERFNEFPFLRKKFLNSFEKVAFDSRNFREIFNLSAVRQAEYSIFQSKTTHKLLQPNDGLLISQIKQDIMDALDPYIYTHYFVKEADFEICLPYSRNKSLPFSELLAIYCVMFYLSNLVRYRPDYLEKLLNTKSSWLIESFVNNTPENFLRIMVSRILGQEFMLINRE